MLNIGPKQKPKICRTRLYKYKDRCQNVQDWLTISYAQPVCSAFDIKTDVILDERKLKKDQTNLIMLGS